MFLLKNIDFRPILAYPVYQLHYNIFLARNGGLFLNRNKKQVCLPLVVNLIKY